jgi:hypothetical protein
MANTKGDVISDAYDQMRISGLTVDPTPEDTTIALVRLESMMAQLEARNICFNYNFQEVPDPSDLTNVELKHQYTLSTNLTLRLASSFGKPIPLELSAMAQSSLASSSSMVAADNIRQVSAPNRSPLGSGTSGRYGNRQRFSSNPMLPPEECATNIITIGGIDDYSEDFTAYLNAGELISSFVITSDNGLTLVSSSNDSPLISYRVEAVSNSTQGRWQQVKIVITTDSGRVTTRLASFDVRSN